MQISPKDHSIVLEIVDDSLTSASKYEEDEDIYNWLEDLSHINSSHFELEDSNGFHYLILIDSLAGFCLQSDTRSRDLIIDHVLGMGELKYGFETENVEIMK